jgi:hypothetical protein
MILLQLHVWIITLTALKSRPERYDDSYQMQVAVDNFFEQNQQCQRLWRNHVLNINVRGVWRSLSGHPNWKSTSMAFIWEWNLIVMFVAHSLQERVLSQTISILFILIFESISVHCVKSRSLKLVVSKHTLNQFTTKRGSSVLWEDVTSPTPG